MESYGRHGLADQNGTGSSSLASTGGGTAYDTSTYPTQRNLGAAAEEVHRSNGNLSPSKNNGLGAGDQDGRDTPKREKSRMNGSAGGKLSPKICQKCGEPMNGQFVRAIGGIFHLDCFRCSDCGVIVASKFFPIDDENGIDQYPLCETDYFRRLDLLCFNCGGALRGSYITALDHKYHIDHFTCSVCPTAFGAKDSYYEHEDNVYCHYHYSTRFAQRCSGCRTSILKQFVELFRNGQNNHWHPECYMIHKFWNVRLAVNGDETVDRLESDDNATEIQRSQIRLEEEQMEERVFRIWSVLSAFEESAAACISDMLLHVSNGAYVDGVLVAKKFIWHVDILFSATDRLDNCVISHGFQGLVYGREAKLLCKKIVAFFTLLSKTQETGIRRLGVTQELLSLVTGLAHYLKLLIRISLQGALKLERDKPNTHGLYDFLDSLSQLDSAIDYDDQLDYVTGMSELSAEQADLCHLCQEPIEGECLKTGDLRWHGKHLQCDSCHRELGDGLETSGASWSEQEQKAWCPQCSRDNLAADDAVACVRYISRLYQYVYLLRVALARLLSVLRAGGTLPHTSDDPNLINYDSNEGHRMGAQAELQPPMLRVDARSKSYGGTPTNERLQGSSYEQTVGEMKRLRSTRMDKHLSTTIRKARTSRIIDGPEGQSIVAGNLGLNGLGQRTNKMQIIEDRDAGGDHKMDLAYGHQDALTLDDIPRIVAAEQAKEQRPNAWNHAGERLLSNPKQPKLLNGQQRDVSGGDGPVSDYAPQKTKRYFSELSALEYFIVRHIAVLQMQPLLEGHFTLDDLLGLIESRKPNFWNRFGKAFKNDKAKGGKKKGVFGVSLDTLIEKDGVESTYGVGPGALRVPALLDDTITAMRQMDMSVEGVFRKNGNIKGLKILAEKIDAKETEVDLSKENPVQVAALLKRFLRELPDPLLTHKLYDLYTTSQKIADEEKRKRLLHLTCCLLPKIHRDSVEVLCSFLNWTASFADVGDTTGSRMDVHNLATVVTPNILRGIGVDESYLAIEAVYMLIEYNDQLCEVPEDIQSILVDTPLFSTSSDITTKEILKRYGEATKSSQKVDSSTKVGRVDVPPLRAHGSNGATRNGPPIATRVDADPHQASAWQKESLVRHVQGNGASPYANQNTPPQHSFEFGASSSPYHHRAGSSESAGSYGTPNRNSHRQSNWAKNPSSASVGGTGPG